MASLYTRPTSPYYYIRYFDRKSGTWRSKSTKYRNKSASDRRKASELEARLTLEEREQTRGSGAVDQDFDSWVLGWMDLRYEESPKTLHRYRGIWKNLRFWFEKHKVRHPREITREMCMDYVTWRRKPEDCPWLYKCGKNNALMELKFLTTVMREARQRGHVNQIVTESLGIKKAAVPEKRALTNEEIKKIRKNLVNEPDWMGICFEISLYQALRLQQCAFPLSCCDFKRGTITYPSEIVKGVGDVNFTHPIDPRLLPLLKRLHAEGRVKTCEIPQMASKAWWKFFKKIGIHGICFHCLRVNWITRAAIAEIPLAKTMRFVNHASSEIHRVYTKLQSDDIKDVPSRVQLPEAP